MLLLSLPGLVHFSLHQSLEVSYLTLQAAVLAGGFLLGGRDGTLQLLQVKAKRLKQTDPHWPKQSLHADHQTAGPDFCVCRHTDEAAKGLHQSCNQAWPRHATLGGKVLFATHEAAQYVRQAMLHEYSRTHPKRQLQKERCAASVFRMVFGRAERRNLWQLT